MIKASVQWNGPGALSRVRVASWRSLVRAVVYFHGHIIRALNVSANPKYRRGKSPIYLNPSKPGEPPHKRTGWLQRNVVYELNETAGAARVGLNMNAFYGLFLELGTRKMRARPWLLATLKKVFPQMQAMMQVEEVTQ